MPVFSLELLQAVNDWQRGFDAKQKSVRLVRLRDAAASVDERFKLVAKPCYRQLALEPKFVMQMGLRYRLDETVSSWTMHYNIARDFKGGVVPAGMGFLPVIVRRLPDPKDVVISIAALYADPDWRAETGKRKNEINGYWDGIGRYDDSQSEVVLELDSIYLHEVYAAGGHSTSRDQLLSTPHVQAELARFTQVDRERISRAIERGEGGLGPRWLRAARKDRVLRKWIEWAEQLTTQPRPADADNGDGSRTT